MSNFEKLHALVMPFAGYWPALAGLVAAAVLWSNRKRLFRWRPSGAAVAGPGIGEGAPWAARPRASRDWLQYWPYIETSFIKSRLALQRGGLLALAVALGACLSIASFMTTYHGLQNFTTPPAGGAATPADGSGMVALLAAVGIQGTLYIASWYFAHGSAQHANRWRQIRRQRQVQASYGTPVSGGLLDWLGSIYVINQPLSVLMLGITLAVSIFFSFDSFFDLIDQTTYQTQTNLKVARSEIVNAFGDIDREVRAELGALAAHLRDSSEWAQFKQRLDTITKVGANAKDRIEALTLAKRSALEGELAKARANVLAKRNDVADSQAKLNVLNQTAAGGNAVVGGIRTRIDDTKARVDKLTGEIDDLQANVDDFKTRLLEETSTGTVIDPKSRKRSHTGCGPRCREIEVDLKAAQINLSSRQRQLNAAKGDLDAAQREADVSASAKGRLAAKLATDQGALASLQSTLDDIQKRYDELGSAGGLSAAPDTSSTLALITNIQDAATNFSGSGSRVAFKAMTDGCAGLIDLLGRSPDIKASLQGATCDTTNLSALVDPLLVADEALGNVQKTCAPDDEFNDYETVKAIIDRGRKCLSVARLPGRTTAAQRSAIDRIEQENSPGTSHFERTTSSLRRGDMLAWLALGIAAAIDLLVLIVAMLSARVIYSPGSERDDIRIASHVDPAIYQDDPVDIVNFKLLASLLDPEPLAKADDPGFGPSHYNTIDMAKVPREHVRRVLAVIQAHLASDPPRAHTVAGRPGVYRLENSLVQHINRELGHYGLRKKDLRQQSDRDLSDSVGPLQRFTPDWDPAADPYRPFDLEGDTPDPAPRPQPAAADRKAADAANKPNGQPAASGWTTDVDDARGHPDTKLYPL